jgi:hypothetical protein
MNRRNFIKLGAAVTTALVMAAPHVPLSQVEAAPDVESPYKLPLVWYGENELHVRKGQHLDNMEFHGPLKLFVRDRCKITNCAFFGDVIVQSDYPKRKAYRFDLCNCAFLGGTLVMTRSMSLSRIHDSCFWGAGVDMGNVKMGQQAKAMSA